jgi:type IV pilus assembly protein PilE
MHKRTGRGFTLIELMIVVAVVAILAAIALPGYAAYIQRANRAHAKAALLQAAQWMERAATAQGAYPDTLPAGMNAVEGGRYTVSLQSNPAALPPTFILTATRVSGGGNANDACGDFTVNNVGVRGLKNNSASMSVTDCWGK